MNYNKAEFTKSYGLSSQLPDSNEPEIAFAGRSNVGKSSLLNKLFNRKNLARVSSVPGKTITINFYDVEGISFVDLPGYGYAKLSKQELSRFGELMEGYFQSGRNIALVVQLIDMRHPLTGDDEGMITFLKEMDIPFIIVMTKADKLKKKAVISSSVGSVKLLFSKRLGQKSIHTNTGSRAQRYHKSLQRK